MRLLWNLDGLMCLALPPLARWTAVAYGPDGDILFVFDTVKLRWRSSVERWREWCLAGMPPEVRTVIRIEPYPLQPPPEESTA